MFRCTALQAAQAEAKAQDHKFHTEAAQNRNTPADDYIDEINKSNMISNNQIKDVLVIENPMQNLEEDEDYTNLIQDRKLLKRDKFREMLESNEEHSLLNLNKNLMIRKSSQFPSNVSNNNNLPAKNIKKSKTFYNTKENSDYANYNSISEASSNYYPYSKTSQSRASNYIPINEDYRSSENDSLTVRGYRTSQNKTPHVSFFLHQNKEQNSGLNNNYLNSSNNNRINNKYSSNSISSRSKSINQNGKKIVSLHLQFTNNNANSLVNTINDSTVTDNKRRKSYSFREELTSTDDRTSNRKPSAVQQNKSPFATQLSSNNPIPSNSANKFYFEQNEQNAQNNEYYASLSSQKYTPISDNRFQDMLRVVRPPYLLNEVKDVNKIIEKNDALKESNLDMDTRERMSKMKEKGYKLAMLAKKAIFAGDYVV